MPRPAPDPARRNERSRRAILAATVALIVELGYERVSVEAVARRAGVGKQTIYRWWSSKGAIALESLQNSLRSVADFPDTGVGVEDLRVQMTGVTELLRSPEVGAVYQGLLAAAQSDRALSRAHLELVIEPATAEFRRRLAYARARGELGAEVDDQVLIDMLYGAIYYRLLLHTRPLESDQVDAALAIAFRSRRAQPRAGPAPGLADLDDVRPRTGSTTP